jgi:starvation-inducible DNA-binding protein
MTHAAGRTLVLPATTAMSSPNPPLSDEAAEAIGRELQLTLVELIGLSLAGKQLQWTSYGREFATVHLHRSKLVEEWRALEDVVAARVDAVGIALDGSAAAVLELDDQRPLEPGFIPVAAAVERLWEVAFRVRQRGELHGGLDAISQSALIGVGGTLEAQLWMLRAQLAD